MKRLRNAVLRFAREDDGMETLEYAILIGLIVAATLSAIIAVGAWVNTQFTTVQSTLGA